MVVWIALFTVLSVGDALSDQVDSGPNRESPTTTSSGITLPIPQAPADETNDPLEGPAPFRRDDQSNRRFSNGNAPTPSGDQPNRTSQPFAQNDDFQPRPFPFSPVTDEVSKSIIPKRPARNSSLLSSVGQGLLAPPARQPSDQIQSKHNKQFPLERSDQVSEPSYARIRIGGPTTEPLTEQVNPSETLPAFRSHSPKETQFPAAANPAPNDRELAKIDSPQSSANALNTMSNSTDQRTAGHGFGQFPRGMRLPGTPSGISEPIKSDSTMSSLDNQEELQGMITQTFSNPVPNMGEIEESRLSREEGDRFVLESPDSTLDQEAFGISQPSLGQNQNRSFRTTSDTLGSKLAEENEIMIPVSGDRQMDQITSEEPASGLPGEIAVVGAPSFKTSEAVKPQPLINGLLLVSIVSNFYLIFWLKRLRIRFHDLVTAKRLVDQERL